MVKKKILTTLDKFADHDFDLRSIIKDIHIVGSIGTNQWVEDVDIDVHIIPKMQYLDRPEDFQRIVKKFFNEQRDEIDGWINKHPIEVYIQLNPAQDMMSAGVYDLDKDEWLKGPQVVPENYDPYEDFGDIFNELRGAVSDADKFVAELKRDVIDYTTIKKAIKYMSSNERNKLMGKLNLKLKEMEQGIKELYRTRKEWVIMRKQASQPVTAGQALDDINLAKKWKDTNALFKFIARYKYIKVIGDLAELLANDDKISDDEVDMIQGIVGV